MRGEGGSGGSAPGPRFLARSNVVFIRLFARYNNMGSVSRGRRAFFAGGLVFCDEAECGAGSAGTGSATEGREGNEDGGESPQGGTRGHKKLSRKFLDRINRINGIPDKIHQSVDQPLRDPFAAQSR